MSQTMTVSSHAALTNSSAGRLMGGSFPEPSRSRCRRRHASARCPSVLGILEYPTQGRRPARGGVQEDDDGSVDHRQ